MGLLCCPVQRFMNITAIDDYLGLGAHFLLKLIDLFRGETDDLLFPRRIDIGPSRAVCLHAIGDMNKR